MQIIDILLIDDDKGYCREVKNQLRSIGIDEYDYDVIVKDFQNLEEGFAELEKESKYKAVILDAQCLLTKEQEKENFQFLPEALDELEKINQRTGTYTPFVVNTGYKDTEVLNSLSLKIQRHKGKIFDKSKQAKEMLQYLLAEIDNAENTKIEKQYEDVFEIFNKGYLNSENRIRLIEGLKKLDNSPLIKDDFNALRKVLEAIYEKLKDKSLIRDEIYGNLERTWRYLSGMPVNIGTKQNPNYLPKIPALFPIHISQNIKTVEELSSPNSHYSSDDVRNYTYKSAVFALLAVIIWFKKLMEKP